ncbi:MAG: hypothetical protein ACK5LJ_00290 [Paracoccus sp. (in: a-proteobacteria)]
MRYGLTLAAVLILAACGGGSGNNQRTTSSSTLVDPAALYCQGTGGQVIERVSRGRRADLCRLPSGKTVRTADLINAHNDL